MRTATVATFSAALLLAAVQFIGLGAILGNSLGHAISAQTAAHSGHTALLQDTYGAANGELRVSQK
jgi:hypothetical protein